MRQETWSGGGWSRRQLLRRSGAALAAATAGSSTGCLSLLPPASRTGRYGNVDVPRRGDDRPVYRKWFPAESALPELEDVDGSDDLSWTYVTPGDLGADQFGADFDIGRSVIQASIDYVGYPIGEYDRLVGVDPLGTVVEASVDRDTVRETMERTSYETAGTYREYDVYDRTDVPRLVAVADDVIVHAHDENRRSKAEVLIDAGAGRVRRRHEVDESFAAYTDHIGSAPTILAGFGLLEGSIADCLRFTFDDTSAYFVHEHRFVAGETPSKSAVKREVDDLSRGERAASVDVTVDDPYVRVALRLEQSAYETDEAYHSLPFVTWGVEDGPDEITISHDAGDPVPVANLEIEPSDALRNGPAAGSSLEAGDELAFATDDVTDAADDIQFTYRQSEDSSTRLFHYEPANASPP